MHGRQDLYRGMYFSSWLLLIDLPGVGDINRIRANVAEYYIPLCSHILVLAAAKDRTKSLQDYNRSVSNIAREMIQNTSSGVIDCFKACTIVLTKIDENPAGRARSVVSGYICRCYSTVT